MIRITLTAALAAGGLFVTATLPHAASGEGVGDDCTPDTARDDMTYEDAQAVYDCLAGSMQEGYLTGDTRWIPRAFVADYRNWTAASTLPADPGVHGGRFLLTWVNKTGAEEYMKFAEERGAMPAGTVIAKESFAVGEDGKAAPGPLFLMQKTAEGVSPRTNDWYYMAVQPNGRPMAIDVFKACNECHEAYADSDHLGYPEEDVRATGG